MSELPMLERHLSPPCGTWCRRLLVSGLAMVLAGCVVGPDHVPPTQNVPSSWRTTEPAVAPVADLANLAWWQGFEDPTLNSLVRLALDNNQDLKIAVARVRQYQARQAVSQSQQWPEVGIQGRSARDKLSEERQAPLSSKTPVSSAAYEIQGRVSWELDLWGRVQRSNEAATAELLAVEENRRAITLSVVSDVVSAYVDLLGLDRELSLMKAELANRQDNLRLLESRQRSGGSSQLPVTQARAVLQETAAAIPVKEREIAAREDALSVLLGMNPAAVARGHRLAELRTPSVPAGLPSELLTQRPDLRQAEQNLIAANARIGVAKAEYFPTLSLTGSYGFASTDLSRFLVGPATFGTAGTDLLAKVFTGGRIEANVREAEAVRLQQLETYRKAVLNAFLEVEDALVLHRKAVEREALLGQQVAEAQTLVALQRKRLEGGLGTRFDLLEAERAALLADRSRSLALHDIHSSLILLYKSLGGGWQVAAPDLTKLAGTADKNPTAESTVHE